MSMEDIAQYMPMLAKIHTWIHSFTFYGERGHDWQSRVLLLHIMVAQPKEVSKAESKAVCPGVSI